LEKYVQQQLNCGFELHADGTLHLPRSTFVNPVIIKSRWYRERP